MEIAILCLSVGLMSIIILLTILVLKIKDGVEKLDEGIKNSETDINSEIKKIDDKLEKMNIDIKNLETNINSEIKGVSENITKSINNKSDELKSFLTEPIDPEEWLKK
ncbi:MAG TPA: hypothetical protein PLD35_01025 [Caldisericia bacterium]|jgi:predicted PurR-regulated permease PerM|nr:hypothetical protein [Caldisericia bacterium]HXK69770.1 hypothetical protein [Caldisericia bacterium]